jgi:molybdopterin converting factor small subunit
MIRVRLEPCGPLREAFGAPEYEYDLPDGASLGDLLDRIGAEHGERLASIWNQRERRFRGPVVIMTGTRVVKDRSTPLRDRQTVSLYKAVVGG